MDTSVGVHGGLAFDSHTRRKDAGLGTRRKISGEGSDATSSLRGTNGVGPGVRVMPTTLPDLRLCGEERPLAWWGLRFGEAA